MQNDENRRKSDVGFRDAPDVGAFYFEDAAKVLAGSGCVLGRLVFTLPPRQSEESAALGGNYGGIPPKTYRVLRRSVAGHDNSGAPVCDLLLTAEKSAGGNPGKRPQDGGDGI